MASCFKYTGPKSNEDSERNELSEGKKVLIFTFNFPHFKGGNQVSVNNEKPFIFHSLKRNKCWILEH